MKLYNDYSANAKYAPMTFKGFEEGSMIFENEFAYASVGAFERIDELSIKANPCLDELIVNEQQGYFVVCYREK